MAQSDLYIVTCAWEASRLLEVLHFISSLETPLSTDSPPAKKTIIVE